ncbi:NUDIX hydrolase [Clostridium hydrogeniformans]|uniref:NUDIX hydrolase n=1 Tax=Clostridium hydrogeniformans TaxID=349933 RepID=UPI00048A105E|nr:NUDIX hydrolase [Clostridium hydrogeniformans]
MGYVENLRKLVGHTPLILMGSVVIIINNENKILLQKRKSPYILWGLPGGLMELSESTEDTARREVLEETGLTLGKLKLIDVFSGPEYFIKLPSKDEFYVVTAAYYTNSFNGKIVIDKKESLEFKFIDPYDLPEEMVKSHRKIIETFLSKI